VPEYDDKKKGDAAETQPSQDQEGQADEAPEEQEEITPEAKEMAKGCFQRAKEATQHNNFDYAIRLYLDGLRYNPRDLEDGHRGLRDCALRRRNQGKGGGLGALLGQAKGAFSQMLGRHKDQMLALEEALARDPQNVTLLMQLMQTVRRLGYEDLAIWFGEIAAEETLRAKKPQKQVFITLADLYEKADRYQDAVDALGQAVKIDPSERSLDKRARDLSARASITEGKLEEVGDFHDMIRDRAQASASATQRVVRTREQLDAQYEDLKAALDKDPDNPIKMEALADNEARRSHIDEAMKLLQQALDQTGEYRYKLRMDDIRMAEFRRKIRQLNEQLEAEPDRQDLKAKRQKLVKEQNEFELKAFTERHKQYPTDLPIRYELGLRQYRNKDHDAAIVSFQTTTRDPKRRIPSLNMLGKCFFAKKLYREAQSQFENAIEQYELTDDPLAKELRYNLARTFEVQNKVDQAIEWYSVIVQQDYQYQDAAKRLEALRRKQSAGEAGQEGSESSGEEPDTG